MPAAEPPDGSAASNRVADKDPTSSASESRPGSVSGGGGSDDPHGYGSTQEHVFSDPAVADHWRAVYERAGYENRHRFDPSFQWSAEEERKLVRKIDLRIMLW